MKNKNVGFLITGIALVIGIIILIFNFGLKDIVSQSCSHGPECSMYETISIQTWVSLAIAFLVLLIGITFIFSKDDEKIIIKKIKPYAKLEPKKFDEKSLDGLNKEERDIMNLVLENKGSLFQSEIVEKSGLSKVKVTRLLDNLEGKGLIERKRRGMTNIVLIKYK